MCSSNPVPIVNHLREATDMLDDLRNSAGGPFLDDENLEEDESSRKRFHGNFLGMTAVQRFVVSVFLFLMVVIVGVFVLILFQKVYL